MTKWIQDRDTWKTCDHRKLMQDECMSALRIFIRFMQLRKLGLFFKTSISLKPEFLTNVPQAKCFIIGLIIHLKTLTKCQKRKELKKQVFEAKKAQWVKIMANRLNRLRNQSTGCARPIEDRSREAKKFLSLPIAFFSRSRGFSYRSRSG